MSVIDTIRKAFGSSNNTANHPQSSDEKLLQALKQNRGQYIVKSNGAIALDFSNPETQERLLEEIEKYKDFSVSARR